MHLLLRRIVIFWRPLEHILAHSSITVGQRGKMFVANISGYLRITLRCHSRSAVVNDRVSRGTSLHVPDWPLCALINQNFVLFLDFINCNWSLFIVTFSVFLQILINLIIDSCKIKSSVEMNANKTLGPSGGGWRPLRLNFFRWSANDFVVEIVFKCNKI